MRSNPFNPCPVFTGGELKNHKKRSTALAVLLVCN